MIIHTLTFAFPPEMPIAERDRFFTEIEQLMLDRGGAVSCTHHAHLPNPGDEHAPVFVATDIAHMTFPDLDQVTTASALPELGEFIGGWQSRYPYQVVWVNHEPSATTPS